MISFAFSAIFVSVSISLLLNAFWYSILFSFLFWFLCFQLIGVLGLHIYHCIYSTHWVVVRGHHIVAGSILLLILTIVLHCRLFTLFIYSGLTFGMFPRSICSQCPAASVWLVISFKLLFYIPLEFEFLYRLSFQVQWHGQLIRYWYSVCERHLLATNDTYNGSAPPQ